MSGTGSLELAIALIKEHQGARGPGTHLVLALDSELERNHEIYDTALRHIEGVYIAVDRMTEARVKGAIDPSLRSVLIEGLRLSALALEIEIRQDRDDVVVGLASGILPTNESERLIPAFVAALFSRDLSAHSVAAISWTDTRLEVLAKDAVWQLIRTQVAGRRLGSLTTLIFISGGRIDPELHCEHEPGVRFALTERGLSKRKGRTSLEFAVNRLVRDAHAPLVLFLGAGASVSAQMPLGNEVRDYALEHFVGDKIPPPMGELALRFHQWILENDRFLVGEETLTAAMFVERLTLERVLREEFQRDGRDHSPTLRHLQEKNAQAIQRRKTRVRAGLRTITAKPQRLVIVTVNFDTILEDEFGAEAKVFATKAEFEAAADYLDEYLTNGGAVPVLKLHGTLTVPDSIVADVDTRSLGISAGAIEALQRLRGTGRLTPWVYIGTSMRDPDVTEVVGGKDFAERLEEAWVAPFPDPAVSAFTDTHRESRWQEEKRAGLAQRQITETADKFLSALAAAWPD